MIGVDGAVLNVHEWLSRAALEVIGESETACQFLTTIYSIYSD